MPKSNQPKISADQFLDSGAYLPPPLRDFHDAKDVFKTMHATIDMSKRDYDKDVSWAIGQCYVIDIFLWFMARRGWTMQRSRANVEFRDLNEDVRRHTEAQDKAFVDLLNHRLEQMAKGQTNAEDLEKKAP